MNKQNHSVSVLDYDCNHIESNHNDNCNYICLEISSEQNEKKTFAQFDVSIFSRHEPMQ